MLREYKKKLFFILGLAFLAHIISIFFFKSRSLSESCRTITFILFFYGSSMYAMGKGRSWIWGLFGILSFLGLFIISFLKDSFPKDTNRPKIFIFFGCVMMFLGMGLFTANSLAPGDDITTVSIAYLLFLGGIGLKEQFR